MVEIHTLRLKRTEPGLDWTVVHAATLCRHAVSDAESFQPSAVCLARKLTALIRMENQPFALRPWHAPLCPFDRIDDEL